MALVQEKKGGPHTKQEQKERKDKVYDLHFEKGYSAVKIAEMLQVNRNTVNEDINYWYTKVVEELPVHSTSLLLKQIKRLETQQARLLEELEKSTEFKEKINIEKLLFTISSKIASHYSKAVFHNYDKFNLLQKTGNYEQKRDSFIDYGF